MLIDATAVPVDRGGVGRYVDALVTALAADGARISVACQIRDEERYAAMAPGAGVVTATESALARTARLAWEQTTLPVLARRLAADVVHSPHYTLPLANRAASVVTLHDATFFTAPEVHAPIKTRFFRSWSRLALRRAGRCIVPSAATAGELAAVAKMNHDRVDIVPHGVDPGGFYVPLPEQVREARRAIGLADSPGDERYVAFLGPLEPRKNVPALVRGFARAVRERAEPPTLVLAGRDGWDGEVDRALDEVPPGVRVIRTGYLPYELLAGFLGGAELVAYPSLGEGFGLPVLEAMACGACVLTTRRLALPEVGGDCVAYCAVDPDGIARALVELLDDPHRRTALGAAAQLRAKEFSWSVSADGHRASYDRAWWGE
ncbi:glycosyltransferase family 1 protein [Haloechinothrix sp. LS1_15]|uniref:glycosyltransferase family 4 protein n=1 Tax=Haloechinothrix sp. LS1_15 TaxID=2652248 RepID=UPI002944BE39|nr:glycosyltransferase family 1 protein [Haloechinothrix sp. LS1_15]MDV6013916.1 glycosyltransferase family 4 protein [Haloechinothrix sp. LS1_15]